MRKTVKVWDPFVRLFHWALAAGLAADYLYLEGGHDYFGGYKLHDWLGYFLGGWVLVRIAWGFTGTRHARFTDFSPTPRKLFAHLGATLRGRRERYLGHNPAGGAMVLALLLLVVGVCVTGWMRGLDAFWGEEWLDELHVLLADVIAGLVVVHVASVLWMSWLLKENLILAMVTGRKNATAADAAAPRRRETD